MSSRREDNDGVSHAFSVGGLGLVVLAHALVLAGLLAAPRMQPVPVPTALTVHLVPAQVTAPAPAIRPVAKPAVVVPRAQMPQPARPVPLPVPVTSTAPPSANAVPTDLPVAASSPAAAPAASTVAESQPRYDADYLQNPAPGYPAAARRLGEEGKVMLHVRVDTGGRPVQIDVRTGSGSPRLDRAAVDAVWRWRFVAARRGDTAVEAWVLVPIIFNLKQ
ncbi:TonB family protein [uncultured Propionivibrio sp.]|uniref:energy transducer TonB n=1 Tax=uncultured Propionivibrio sp. TaxID=426737 RepID=UPI0029BFDF54|nr:TonB family protein [uncultured Propionivibrio sp.]